jgi:hypothetical protein
MAKRITIALLAVGITILGGCAKTTLVQISPNDPAAYKKEKVIFVVLETGETYEMKDCSVRGDSLAGTWVLRDKSGVKQDEQKTAVALDDVITVQVAKATARSWMFFGFGVGTGFVLTAAAGGALLLMIAMGLSM